MDNVYNALEVSAGALHSTVLRGDGMAFAVGAGANGQTGQNETANKTVINAMKDGVTLERSKNIISLIAGGKHTVALTEKGEVYVCGLNTSYQLSQENTTQSNVLIPALVKDEKDVKVTLSDIAYISAGNANTFAVTKKGEVYVAGYNNYGQFGQGDNVTPVQLFVKVKDQNGTDTLQNIDYVVRGSSNTQNMAFIASDGTVYTCGTGTNGELADEVYTNSYLPVIAGNISLRTKDINIVMTVGDTYKVEKELIQSGNAYGYNKSSNNIQITSSNEKVGTVGADEVFTAKAVGYTIINIEDKTNNIRTAIKVSVEPYKGKVVPSINSAVSSTYALKADGTVWAFGYNEDGRLGVGDFVNKTKETPVLSPSGKGILKDVKQLEAGYTSASALLMDGTVVSWGLGANSTLGNGSTDNVSVPSYVITTDGEKLTDIVKIARSHYAGLALKKDRNSMGMGI